MTTVYFTLLFLVKTILFLVYYTDECRFYGVSTIWILIRNVYEKRIIKFKIFHFVCLLVVTKNDRRTDLRCLFLGPQTDYSLKIGKTVEECRTTLSLLWPTSFLLCSKVRRQSVLTPDTRLS